MVNEPTVFEPLKFYCKCPLIITKLHCRSLLICYWIKKKKKTTLHHRQDKSSVHFPKYFHFSLLCYWVTSRAWNTLFALLRNQCYHISVTIATKSSYWSLSDATGSNSTKVLSTIIGNSTVAMALDLCHHLTYDSRGAWHTLYAMLPSNNKSDATWNSYNGKEWFSQTYYSFSKKPQKTKNEFSAINLDSYQLPNTSGHLFPPVQLSTLKTKLYRKPFNIKKIQNTNKNPIKCCVLPFWVLSLKSLAQ